MIIAGTGHRPDKLGFGKQGYQLWVFERLVVLAEAVIHKLRPEMVISGMALGWDQALAKACVNLDQDWTAAIPFEGQESAWPESSQDSYFWLLDHATEKALTCAEPGYAAWKMHQRNRWMVNKADRIVALWDGEKKGGTWGCVEFAWKQKVPVTHCWNAWLNKYSRPA